jgi:SAM-dependent methyltransferase
MKRKEKDEYDSWDNYTQDYSNQIVNEMSKVHSLFITKFKFKNGGLMFYDADNLHPNWKEIYNFVIEHDIKSVFECGCGSGQHLKNINIIKPSVELYGCDLLETQINFGKNQLKIDPFIFKNISVMNLTDSTLYKKVDRTFELVYTQAVIMHLNTDKAISFITNMLRLSSKYVLLIERADDHDFPAYFDLIKERRLM